MFLVETVEEVNSLIIAGIPCNDLTRNAVLKSVVCDAPATAFVKQTTQYSGYEGCDKCTTRGTWIGKMTFQSLDDPLRTDTAFRNRDHSGHHKGLSPFQTLRPDAINMVSGFPLDYMHQTCLGLVKRLILIWLWGPLDVRISHKGAQRIGDRLVPMRGDVLGNHALYLR